MKATINFDTLKAELTLEPGDRLDEGIVYVGPILRQTFSLCEKDVKLLKKKLSSLHQLGAFAYDKEIKNDL